MRADLRGQKQLAIIIAVIVVVLWLGYATYTRVWESRWPDVDPTFALLMCAVPYAQAEVRGRSSRK